MGTTIIGTVPASIPFNYSTPIIELKADWTDDWALEPELQLVSCGMHASSSRAATCEVKRRYGSVKLTYETSFQVRTAWNLKGYWLRVSMVGDQGPVVVFVGRIDNESRMLTGNNALPSGAQSWVVSDGVQILEKQHVSSSYFLNSDNSVSEAEWIPVMNAKDRRHLLVGNRSSSVSPDDGVYMYGGSEVWTHAQYVDYLLTEFIQQENGPTWTVGGQFDILEQMETTIAFHHSITVLDMLRMLIPIKYGVDFRVQPTDDGYEITIFALLSKSSSVAGVTLPMNPNVVEIQKDNQLDLVEVQLVQSDERKVDSIRILGKRIVVCGSLRGLNAPGSTGSLVPKWADQTESDYILAGGPDADTTENDKQRRRDVFRTVYQQFGAPSNWDLDQGTWAIDIGLDGEATNDVADYQTSIRETLSWIPLREGYDYSSNPAVNNNPTGLEPDLKAPHAWIFDENPEEGEARYVQCDLNGISVGKPHLDWGIFVNPSPNHKLALNHWTDAQTDTSDIEPQYDYDTLVCTIAIEGDQRLKLGYDVPDNLAAGDGSIMTVVDEHAEYWCVLPSTIIDIDAGGTFITSPPQLTVLRNDADRLALLLAGLVMKYINERVRAKLIFKGFLPWSNLLGSILTTIQQGDDVQQVGAPFTSIEWVVGNSPQTIISTGYA